MSEIAISATQRAPQAAEGAPETPPLGRRYDVGGRRLMLDRSGEGGPAVVFLPGAGLTGLDFLNVQAEIARFATAVVYDRAGTGWSDAVKLPRTAAEVARELRALLGAAGIAPPYVLVGHSLGGAYARRYAQLFPAEVAGLVFLDPAHEGYQTDPPMALWAQVRMAAKALPALLNGRRFYRPLFARTLEAWPDALRERLTDYHVRFWRRSLDEAANLNGPVLDEIKTGGPMPEVPLVVLTAMGIDPFMAPFMDAGYLREVNVRKAGHYDALAASVPGGENRRIADAGHSTLHTDRPHAVVQAVRDVVEAIRTTRAI